jgi:hypothetical protein
MATLLKTSRTQVDRLLSAKDDITLSSLQQAAAMVGRRVTVELVYWTFSNRYLSFSDSRKTRFALSAQYRPVFRCTQFEVP